MSLPERLKIVRAHLKKSQRALAQDLAIAVRSWQVYEEGKSIPGGEVFESLCKLGFNANWLLTGQGLMLREVEQKEGVSQEQIQGQLTEPADALEQDFKLVKNIVEAYEFVLNDRQELQEGNYKALAIAFNFKDCKQIGGDWTLDALIEKIRRM